MYALVKLQKMDGEFDVEFECEVAKVDGPSNDPSPFAGKRMHKDVNW